MATVNTADAWRPGRPAERSAVPPRPGWADPGDVRGRRPSRPVPPLPPQVRAAGRARPHDDPGEFRRSAPGQWSSGSGRRRPAEYGHPGERRPAARAADPNRSRRADPRGGRGADPRGGRTGDPRAAAAPRVTAARRGRGDLPAETGGSRLRGILAVLGVFLLTLGGAAADSLLGIGLGTITLVALAGSAALATLLVRRRDIWSVVVSPPLVFVAVAAVDIALAPSARFSLTTVATLLIRGFPAMGIATGLALVLALIRLAAGRR